ncbi:hypothetical protein [Protofrankia symbiont of Coriaria ruscifolia]|uniref:hypothetical protein n=1 Tax=Protofrankia symbiont of Coriaria ruscifolia TaxID=1306542 RepID=UPI001A947039|nr:hypothetical protein [Protofrankia symbiont of Coriaria ruscifolia]
MLRVSDLRRSLLAVLAVTPKPLLRAGDGVTEAEALAFFAGQGAALEAVHTVVARAWRADRVPPGRRGTRPVDAGSDLTADGSGSVLSAVDDEMWAAAVTRLVGRQHFPFLDGPRVPDEPAIPGAATALTGGRLVVVDGDGVVVAEFDAAAWETAHAWVHARVTEPLTRRPVCIEDHRNRQTWQVDIGSCTHIVWMPGEPTGAGMRCPL